MKTTKRTQFNGGNKTLAIQPQSSAPASPGNTTAAALPVDGNAKDVAAFFMVGSAAGPERKIGGVNLSAGEFDQIKACATNLDQDLGEFLGWAIRNHLKLMQRRLKAAAAPHSLCEPEVDEMAAHWGPEKRRATAAKLERWVAQLRFSADAQERFGSVLGEAPELVFPSSELAAELCGKTRAQCLAEAAKFEEWCATIRRMLGVKAASPQTAIVANPN